MPRPASQRPGLVASLPACALLALAGCTTPQAENVAGGAAVGALGGVLLGAVVGNPGAGAAAGAVTGAVVGAGMPTEEPAALPEDAVGPREPRHEGLSPEARKRLRERLGPSAYVSLQALAECDYEKALTWADIAANSTTAEWALAGSWLEAITYQDAGEPEKARERIPELVERDPDVDSPEVAERQLENAAIAVGDIRAAYGKPDACA